MFYNGFRFNVIQVNNDMYISQWLQQQHHNMTYDNNVLSRCKIMKSNNSRNNVLYCFVAVQDHSKVPLVGLARETLFLQKEVRNGFGRTPHKMKNLWHCA